MAKALPPSVLLELLQVVFEDNQFRARVAKRIPRISDYFAELARDESSPNPLTTGESAPSADEASAAKSAPAPSPAVTHYDESPLSPDPSSQVGNAQDSDLTVEVMDIAGPPSDDSNPEPDSDDDYTVVSRSKKRQRKAAHSDSDEAAKTVRVEGPDGNHRKVAAAIPKVSPATERRPPPIILRDNAKWSSLSSQMTQNKIPFLTASQTKDGIKIQVPTSSAHRALTKLLNFLQFPYHTYALEEEKLHRVVIRGIPKEISEKEVYDDLIAQNIPVRKVHRISSHRNKRQFDMVHVTLERSEAGKAIYGLKSVCMLSGIRMEAPRKTGIPGQCHNCQLYGHSSRTCHAAPRCVKCLESHSTAQCARPKKTDTPSTDSSSPPLPPSCVLCNESGHPANYRGCPRAPKANPKVLQRTLARQTYAVRLAGSQKPAAVVPGVAENTNFPPLRPNPAWALKMGPAPAPAQVAPKPVVPPQPAPKKPAPPPPSPPKPASHSKSAEGDLADALSVVSNFTSLFDIEEIISYSKEIRANAGNPSALIQTAAKYYHLVVAFKNFKP
ncbi:hypothetical protein O0L34_g6855 [Tuta absoluta]|nr:hypothetical protein O0L34_g6855 [Tuta absoluta]